MGLQITANAADNRTRGTVIQIIQCPHCLQTNDIELSEPQSDLEAICCEFCGRILIDDDEDMISEDMEIKPSDDLLEMPF